VVNRDVGFFEDEATVPWVLIPSRFDQGRVRWSRLAMIRCGEAPGTSSDRVDEYEFANGRFGLAVLSDLSRLAEVNASASCGAWQREIACSGIRATIDLASV